MVIQPHILIDIMRDTSKPILRTDKLNKDILNIKHKNKQVMSKTISQFQTPKPLETNRLKRIVNEAMPEVPIDDIIKLEKKKEGQQPMI
jgi:hypothetical protein